MKIKVQIFLVQLLLGFSSVMGTTPSTAPPCDNDSDGKHCKDPCTSEIFEIKSFGVEECPQDTVDVNTFLLNSGNAVRYINDLAIPVNNYGGPPLKFTRRAATRYFAVAPGSLGSGGNWRHNWQWNIYRGLPHASGHETLTSHQKSQISPRFRPKLRITCEMHDSIYIHHQRRLPFAKSKPRLHPRSSKLRRTRRNSRFR